MQSKHTELHPCLGDLVAKLLHLEQEWGQGCAALCSGLGHGPELLKGTHFKELSALCFLLPSHMSDGHALLCCGGTSV